MLALMLEATVASLWSVANIGAGIWIGAGPGPDCASELLSSWIWIWIWYTPGALPTSRDELFNGHLRSPPSRVFQVAHPPTRGIAETSGLGGVVVFREAWFVLRPHPIIEAQTCCHCGRICLTTHDAMLSPLLSVVCLLLVPAVSLAFRHGSRAWAHLAG